MLLKTESMFFSFLWKKQYVLYFYWIVIDKIVCILVNSFKFLTKKYALIALNVFYFLFVVLFFIFLFHDLYNINYFIFILCFFLFELM